jgi:hypothetical protein
MQKTMQQAMAENEKAVDLKVLEYIMDNESGSEKGIELNMVYEKGFKDGYDEGFYAGLEAAIALGPEKAKDWLSKLAAKKISEWEIKLKEIAEWGKPKEDKA